MVKEGPSVSRIWSARDNGKREAGDGKRENQANYPNDTYVLRRLDINPPGRVSGYLAGESESTAAMYPRTLAK